MTTIKTATIINVLVLREAETIDEGAPVIVIRDFDHEEVWKLFQEQRPDFRREEVCFIAWLIDNKYVAPLPEARLLKYRIAQ